MCQSDQPTKIWSQEEKKKDLKGSLITAHMYYSNLLDFLGEMPEKKAQGKFYICVAISKKTVFVLSI